jgi:hypothetical protein
MRQVPTTVASSARLTCPNADLPPEGRSSWCQQIVFEAGTHSAAIRMRSVDFAMLVFPAVAELHRAPSEIW